MKNKGFTLIELIFVIVILAMLSLILVPTVQSLINKNTDNMCTTLNESIITAAKDYVTDTKYTNNYVCNTDNSVTLQTLIDNNYIKGPIIDPRTKEELDTTQIVKFACNSETGEFIYYFKYEKCKSDYDPNALHATIGGIYLPSGGSSCNTYYLNGGNIENLNAYGDTVRNNKESFVTFCINMGMYFTYNGATEIPIPTRAGYVFGGWYYDNGTFLNKVTTNSVFGLKNGTTTIYYTDDGELKVNSQTLTAYAKWN